MCLQPPAQLGDGLRREEVVVLGEVTLHRPAKPVRAEGPWSVEAVQALLDMPFMDLVHQAQTVHRQHFPEGDIELATLLSVKTGGCPENCGYCPQSAEFDTGVKAQKLVDVTYEAMMRGIAAVKPGARLGDIGHAIQSYAESHRFSVVRDFCGHGIGKVFHDSPSILHFGRPGAGPALREGMFFTVEPMINAGRHEVKVLDDGWTAVTRDRSLSAQFEHTVAVTADGVEIFTRSPAGLDRPPYRL